MSVTSRKSAARPEPILEQERRESAGSDRGAVSLRASGRCYTGYQVLLRTPAAGQKSMSLQDNPNIHQSISCKLEFGWRGGGRACVRGGQKTTAQSCTTWRMTRRRRRFRTRRALGSALSDGWGGFSPESGMTKGLRSHLTFLPLRNTSKKKNLAPKLRGGGGKKRLEGLYCFNYIFQLTYVAFKKVKPSQFYLYSPISVCL